MQRVAVGCLVHNLNEACTCIVCSSLAFITRPYAKVEREERHKPCIIPHNDRIVLTQANLHKTLLFLH